MAIEIPEKIDTTIGEEEMIIIDIDEMVMVESGDQAQHPVQRQEIPGHRRESGICKR